MSGFDADEGEATPADSTRVQGGWLVAVTAPGASDEQLHIVDAVVFASSSVDRLVVWQLGA